MVFQYYILFCLLPRAYCIWLVLAIDNNIVPNALTLLAPLMIHEILEILSSRTAQTEKGDDAGGTREPPSPAHLPFPTTMFYQGGIQSLSGSFKVLTRLEFSLPSRKRPEIIGIDSYIHDVELCSKPYVRFKAHSFDKNQALKSADCRFILKTKSASYIFILTSLSPGPSLTEKQFFVDTSLSSSRTLSISAFSRAEVCLFFSEKQKETNKKQYQERSKQKEVSSSKKQ